MMLKGQKQTATRRAAHQRVEWRAYAFTSSGLNPCLTTSQSLQLIGANSISRISAEQPFADDRRLLS